MHQWWSEYLDQLRRGEDEFSLANGAIDRPAAFALDT